MTASLWLDEPYAPRPPLEEDATTDVAVVGGGIAGVAAAYWLARAGARVILLEERELAAGASGRNAGFLLAGVAENFVAASRRYGEERAWRVWQVTLRNRDLVARVAREHAIGCDLAFNGSEQVACDDEEWDEVRESARRLVARGIAVALDERTRTACVRDDGELHPVRFVRGLAAVAETLGTVIHEGTGVTRVERGGVLRTGRATVRAGALVVCTNAHASRLVFARVRPVRGQMLATAPLARRTFARPAYACRGYRYWRQTLDGRVLVGGWRDTALDAEVGEEERVNDAVQRHLDSFLNERGIDAAVTHRWSGIMGFSDDGLPYVGLVAGRIFCCGGFTGHGIGFALACAEIVGALARGGSHPDAELFDPQRA